MKQRGFELFEVVMAISVIVLVAALIYGAVIGDREWQAFRTAHKCKVVAHSDSTANVGMAFTTGNNGGVAPVVTTTSAKTAWLCDDGVTYWKNQ